MMIWMDMDGYGMEPGHFIDFTLFTQWTWSILKLFCWSWERSLEVPCWRPVFWGCPVTKILKTSREKFHIGDVQQSWAHSFHHFPVERPGGFGAFRRMERKNATGPVSTVVGLPTLMYLRVDVFDLNGFLMFLLCCLNRFHGYLKLSNCDLWCGSWSPVVQNSWLQLFSLSDEILTSGQLLWVLSQWHKEPWSRLEQSFY